MSDSTYVQPLFARRSVIPEPGLSKSRSASRSINK